GRAGSAPAPGGGPVSGGPLGAPRGHAGRLGLPRLLISGLEERVSLYAKLGFRALGPAVASGRAAFVPMTLDFDRPPESLRRSIALWEAHFGRGATAGRREAISLPPRPGRLSPRGRAAPREPPGSHRSDAFPPRH